MVGRNKTALLLVVFEHRKVRYPQEAEVAALKESVPLGIFLRERNPQQTGRSVNGIFCRSNFLTLSGMAIVFAALSRAGDDHDKVMLLRSRLRPNLCGGFGIALFQSLEIFKQFRATRVPRPSVSVSQSPAVWD